MQTNSEWHQPPRQGESPPTPHPTPNTRILRGCGGQYMGMRPPSGSLGEWGPRKAGCAETLWRPWSHHLGGGAPSSLSTRNPTLRPKDTIAGAEGRLRCPRTTCSRVLARGKSMVEAADQAAGSGPHLTRREAPPPGCGTAGRLRTDAEPPPTSPRPPGCRDVRSGLGEAQT